MRVYYPVIEPVTQTQSDRRTATAKTALRSTPLSADRAVEAITRPDFAKPCTGFVEYFPDFPEKPETLQRQEKVITRVWGKLTFQKYNNRRTFKKNNI